MSKNDKKNDETDNQVSAGFVYDQDTITHV